jgi:DNA-binding MarR family transcriptional regulator
MSLVFDHDDKVSVGINVLLDVDLTSLEKIVYAIISHLVSNGFASVPLKKLSKAVSVDVRTIQRCISKLEQNGYVSRIYIENSASTFKILK